MSSGLLMILMTAAVMFAPPQVRRPDAVPAHPGTIEGQVHDSTGTPLPSFAVTATEQKSGNPYGAITNETGDFKIEGLPEGTYDLLIRREGFSDVRIPNVSVEPDARKRVNPEVPIKNSDVSQPLRRPGDAPIVPTEVPAPAASTPDSGAIRRPAPAAPVTVAPAILGQNLEND